MPASTTVPAVFALKPVSTSVPVPSLRRPRVSVVVPATWSANAPLNVTVPPGALVVSRPMNEPLLKPRLAGVPLATLVSAERAVTLAAVNSPAPPRWKAAVAPEATVRFAEVQEAGMLL